jgi:hypothetical protein
VQIPSFGRWFSRHAALPIRCGGWQEREKDIRADAVIVSMSATKLSLGAVASLQSPLPFQPSKIIVPRIVIGGVILDQPAGGEIGAVGVDPEGYAWMVGTHKAEPTLQEMKKKMTEQMGQQPAGAAAAA